MNTNQESTPERKISGYIFHHGICPAEVIAKELSLNVEKVKEVIKELKKMGVIKNG